MILAYLLIYPMTIITK